MDNSQGRAWKIVRQHLGEAPWPRLLRAWADGTDGCLSTWRDGVPSDRASRVRGEMDISPATSPKGPEALPQSPCVCRLPYMRSEPARPPPCVPPSQAEGRLTRSGAALAPVHVGPPSSHFPAYYRQYTQQLKESSHQLPELWIKNHVVGKVQKKPLKLPL